MTFKEIQDDALDRLQYDSSQATSGPRTRFKRYINQWHRRTLANAKFSKLRDLPGITFPTVASTPQYGLPPALGKIYTIFDASTNNPRLIERGSDWLRQDPQADLASGQPQFYIPYGLRPIFKKPSSSGSGIWVASSSAADTTQTVRMDAVRLGGYQHSVGPVTLTGVTRKQVGTLTEYIDIEKLFLSAVCAGDITIYDAAAAGNTLGVIPIGLTTARYYLIQLYPVPSSVITYTVEGQARVSDMTQDQDEPMMPEDFHHLLSACARYEELITYKKQYEAADRIWKREIEPLEANMLDHLINHASLIIVPSDGRGEFIGGSNLGGWFPRGRW